MRLFLHISVVVWFLLGKHLLGRNDVNLQATVGISTGYGVVGLYGLESSRCVWNDIFYTTAIALKPIVYGKHTLGGDGIVILLVAGIVAVHHQ